MAELSLNNNHSQGRIVCDHTTYNNVYNFGEKYPKNGIKEFILLDIPNNAFCTCKCMGVNVKCI